MQKNAFLICLTSVVTYFSPAVFGQQTQNQTEPNAILAAVGKGLKHGLHAKYLTYIASQLNSELNLTTISYARRFRELEKGNFDLMVGVQCDQQSDKVSIIQPAYEALSYKVFYKNNGIHYHSLSSLEGKYVGVNKKLPVSSEFDGNNKIKKVELIDLNTKLTLLMKGRLDAFVHLPQATKKQLKRRRLTNNVVMSDIVFNTDHPFCIAVSIKSPWLNKIPQLQQVVVNGVKNGDFAAIRTRHYQ